MVLTHGAGGIRPAWQPGTPVLIKDHLNLTGTTPIEGATFIDMTDLYSSRLRAIARDIDPTLDEGVYELDAGMELELPEDARKAIEAEGGRSLNQVSVCQLTSPSPSGKTQP